MNEEERDLSRRIDYARWMMENAEDEKQRSYWEQELRRLEELIPEESNGTR